MKKMLFPTALAVFSAFLVSSCKSDEPSTPGSSITEVTNDSVLKKMDKDYLWSPPQDKDKQQDPVKYFESILNSADVYTSNGKTYHYSSITKVSGNVGTSYDIGFEYAANNYEDGKTYYVIYYVKQGTDAATKLSRGFLIGKVNNTEVTKANAQTLLQTASATGADVNLIVRIPNGVRDLAVTIKPAANLAIENPLHVSSDTILAGGKKVGYVLFNNFATGANNANDNALASKLTAFKNAGINNLVLDLRYNFFGSFLSIEALGSALVKNRNLNDNLFIYKRRTASSDINRKFIEKTAGNVAIPNLGDQLDKVYIITSQATGGPSESLINGLRAYLGSNLVVVGEKTLGRNILTTPSTLQVPNGDAWRMNIAFAYHADKNGSYNYGNGIAPEVVFNELGTNPNLLLKPLGKTSEALYAKVISLISGARSGYVNDNGMVSVISTSFANKNNTEQSSIDLDSLK
ncbi:MAG: hypothetical protein RL662_596 [Bacteroidota bacterium]|jgi:C-terminal processing protease CtpA/Prc